MKIPNNYLDGFKYRIDKLKPGESVILKWPEIAAYSHIFGADNLGYDIEIAMKYIILMYTPGSPCYRQHPVLTKRKTFVMSILGVEANEKGEYPEYTDMLLLRSDAIRSRVAAFLMIQHDVDWTIMCHAEEELYSLITTKLEEPDPKTVLERRKLIEETRSQFEDAKKRITEADQSRAVWDAIDTFRAAATLKLRPEERVFEAAPAVIPEQAKWPKKKAANKREGVNNDGPDETAED